MQKSKTVVEKIQSIPVEQWVNAAYFAVLIFGVFYIYHKYKKSENKLWFLIVFATVAFIGATNMVYLRNEPAWLTPFVDQLAKFLPTQPK